MCGFPRMKGPCCGCGLQTGAKVIGWLHLISVAVKIGTVISLFQSQGRDQTGWFWIIILVAICFTTLSMIFSICLLIGAYRERVVLLLAWLYYNMATTAMFVIFSIYIFAKKVPVKVLMYSDSRYEEAFQFVIVTCVQLYLQLVIYSYYREVKDNLSPTVHYYASGQYPAAMTEKNDMV